MADCNKESVRHYRLRYEMYNLLIKREVARFEYHIPDEITQDYHAYR